MAPRARFCVTAHMQTNVWPVCSVLTLPSGCKRARWTTGPESRERRTPARGPALSECSQPHRSSSRRSLRGCAHFPGHACELGGRARVRVFEAGGPVGYHSARESLCFARNAENNSSGACRVSLPRNRQAVDGRRCRAARAVTRFLATSASTVLRRQVPHSSRSASALSSGP